MSEAKGSATEEGIFGHRAEVSRWIMVFIGMAGLRIERFRSNRWFILWAFLWILTWILTFVVFRYHLVPGASAADYRAATVIYCAVMWVVYYGGIALLVGTPIRPWVINRLGEAGAWDAFEAILGLVYLHQAVCQSALIYNFGETFSSAFPPGMSYGCGAALFIVGLGCKWWAARLVGLDTYYFKDMFHGRALQKHSGNYVVSGPYKWLRNPMYSVGNLHAYGFAVWDRSLEGVICAAVFQCSIYLFYYLFERRFVIRTYLAGTVETGWEPAK